MGDGFVDTGPVFEAEVDETEKVEVVLDLVEKISEVDLQRRRVGGPDGAE